MLGYVSLVNTQRIYTHISHHQENTDMYVNLLNVDSGFLSFFIYSIFSYTLGIILFIYQTDWRPILSGY